ncbi:hypothetical protein ABZW30_38345, partial [Kitasatospora sp. NPDC004669]|uniref:hypothetical protein n=1 Tax=Kitasatospora sp. NPDC004669 TaxID=3154555 RepID=UPI0033A03909
MGDQYDSVAEKWHSGTASHNAFLELHVGDPALVDSGAVKGGDSLGDRMLVFEQGSGDTGEGRQSAVGEL